MWQVLKAFEQPFHDNGEWFSKESLLIEFIWVCFGKQNAGNLNIVYLSNSNKLLVSRDILRDVDLIDGYDEWLNDQCAWG